MFLNKISFLGGLLLWTGLIRLGCASFGSMSAPTRREDCGTDTIWLPSESAWENAETDASLREWWDDLAAADRAVGFATELGRQFGGHNNGFLCGINDQG